MLFIHLDRKLDWFSMRLLVSILLFPAVLLLGQGALAQTQSIQNIELFAPDSPEGSLVRLPHFIRQSQSDLLTVHWKIRLPEEVKDADIPALLIPQMVQGGRFRLNGQLIYEIASSNHQALRNWYSPTLIQLPKPMLHRDGTNTIEVEQRGHQYGWFVAPMLAGELASLQPLCDTYAFISQTLKTTVYVLCGFFGVFLLFLGIQSKSKIYMYGGINACIWSLLISISTPAEMPHSLWHLWHASVYFLTGWLIYYQILFNFAIYRMVLRPIGKLATMAFMNAGWVIFSFCGKSAEIFLDLAWTGLAFCIYVATLIWIVGVAIQRRDWQRMTAIVLFLLISIALLFHDYTLQTGWLPIHIPTETQALWENLSLQPIYLTHLILPVFIGMTLWLVGKKHIKISRNQWLLRRQLSQERERIVSDIHDGVGSRMNLLLWSLRTNPPDVSHISDELQRCMDELRFAINPPQSGHATLHNALKTLVDRLGTSGHHGIHIQYRYSQRSSTEVSTEIGLHIYKAAQECLSNALRHSGASQITVCLDHREGVMEVSITDNGHGIPNWDNVSQQQLHRQPTSLGLLSIKTRMAQRNGHCRIDSSAQGTRVRLLVPV